MQSWQLQKSPTIALAQSIEDMLPTTMTNQSYRSASVPKKRQTKLWVSLFLMCFGCSLFALRQSLYGVDGFFLRSMVQTKYAQPLPLEPAATCTTRNPSLACTFDGSIGAFYNNIFVDVFHRFVLVACTLVCVLKIVNQFARIYNVAKSCRLPKHVEDHITVCYVFGG